MQLTELKMHHQASGMMCFCKFFSVLKRKDDSEYKAPYAQKIAALSSAFSKEIHQTALHAWFRMQLAELTMHH